MDEAEEERLRRIAVERERERQWAWERDHPELVAKTAPADAAAAKVDRDPRKKTGKKETRRADG